VSGVDWLSEDLLLLALDAGQGRLGRSYAIDYALMGADLVRLAAHGRIDIVDDQVVVRSPAPTGDAELDAALARIGEPATPPHPGEWVERPAPRICGKYLERLIATGVICEQTRFWTTRWRITQTGRLAEARQRLDLIASSVGPVDLSQAAYAGLACAIGMDHLLYPGRRRRAERDRLREIAAGRWTTTPATASDHAAAAAASPDASSGAGRAAIDAATLAAIRAATYAVAHAAAAATMRGVAASSSPGVLSASVVVPGQLEEPRQRRLLA
jgi:golgi phosphoprotein 3